MDRLQQQAVKGVGRSIARLSVPRQGVCPPRIMLYCETAFVITDIRQTRRLSNGLRHRPSCAVPTIESAIANGGHAHALPTLRPINVIASEAKQSISQR